MATQVLICDDSLLARKQMSRVLPNTWDIQVNYACNGEEGLEAIRQGKGEVVFLDLNMPILDGYHVLQKVIEEDLHAMIIVVSGDIQPQAQEKVKALGALSFIKKPFDCAQVELILQEFGLLQVDGEIHPHNQFEFCLDIRDVYQEVANVAMGRAGDLLAQLLDEFVQLSVPYVNIIETSELTMTLKSLEENTEAKALCQGFIASGVSGEALLVFYNTSFADMAMLMGLAKPKDADTEIEVLNDTGNVLIGAFLSALFEQLDMTFSQAHPMVLDQHKDVTQLINKNSQKWQKTLTMEINYQIENFQVECDLLLLFADDSIPTLNNKLAYLLE